MDNKIHNHPRNTNSKSQPIVNLPYAVTIMVVLLIGIHALRMLLSENSDNALLLHTAFFPIVYQLADHAGLSTVDGIRLWSPFTYALMHINWSHVIINTLWLVVFGAPVASRFGPWRFFVFCAACAPFGALAHYLSYGGNGPPVIGASAIVSGLTAAALRFALSAGGLRAGSSDPSRFRRMAPSLVENLKDRQVLGFLVVWLVLNFLFGIGGTLMGGDMQIAWQAHLGGFTGGLLLFALLDPIGRKGTFHS